MANSLKRLVGILAVVGMGAVGSGCALVGGVAESYRQTSTRAVEPDYIGLDGKTFAVVVTAERSIQAEHPSLVDYLTAQMTMRLSDPLSIPPAGGFVPAVQVLKYVYSNPGWTAKPYSDVAADLGGVERLVILEVTEFRLNDPGNQYLWEGVAHATVTVVEADSVLADDVAYHKAVGVGFPDKQGFGPNEMTAATVRTELARRLLDRSSWLFYTHQEPYYPDY